MRPFIVRPVSSAMGRVVLLGDKSIAHRAVIISSLCGGLTEIDNFPSNKDCLSTLKSLQKLGVKIKIKSRGSNGRLKVSVLGKGLHGLRKPGRPIFVGESGTTLRLLLGVLSGQGFETKLVAGKSLSHRPMLRVTAPLRSMGAKIKARPGRGKSGNKEEFPPIVIKGGDLKAIDYIMPVASAQVKSAVILAGLFAKGTSSVFEPVSTRDHTERMLQLFNAGVKVRKKRIFVTGEKELISPESIYVPADISSASFFLVLAAILPNSEICLENVTLNPTRIGIIRVLKRMGAEIIINSSLHQSIGGQAELTVDGGAEPMGDLIVKSSRLRGTTVKKEEVPSLIDELPILMVAACFASGKSVFEGVSELRVKETDRIASLFGNLRRMGADISISKRGSLENIIIQGGKRLKGAKVKSFGDHRTAMSMTVAGLNAPGQTIIDDISCVNKSFPNFFSALKALIR